MAISSLSPRPYIVGIIADTHGLLRPEALAALAGSNWLIHAGDIGRLEILQQLEQRFPVTAVRGNVDRGLWAEQLPDQTTLTVGSVRILILHDLSSLDIDPWANGYQVVISAHSHRPVRDLRNGVLYLNPGNAGPRRFTLPVSVARLYISESDVDAELITLDV